MLKKYIVDATVNKLKFDESDINNICEWECWLKNNVEPFGKIEKYWQKTAAHRLSSLEEKYSSIQEYLKTFPYFSMPLGYILVSIC